MSTLCTIANETERAVSSASKITQVYALSTNLCFVLKIIFHSKVLYKTSDKARIVPKFAKNNERMLVLTSGFNQNMFSRVLTNMDSKVSDLLSLPQKFEQTILSYANQCADQNAIGVMRIKLECSQSYIQNSIRSCLESFTKIEKVLQKYFHATSTKYCQKTLT